ncbi:aminopeptidase N, partial [bacterium]|nr:aminopeptidase N [bacterium]
MIRTLTRIFRLKALIVVILVSSVSCAHLSRKEPNSRRNSLRPPLTQAEAQSRSAHISRVRYALWFAVNGRYPDFEGRTVVQFNWKPEKQSGAAPLFLDFTGGKILSLKVNDQSVPQEQISLLYNGYRLQLPLELLALGQNRVQIAYSQNYSRDGTGVHRFEDPADQKIYLYSNSEPYDANRIFPCFDQPDLKAVYELTVEAPADWAVISNTPEREVTTFDGRASWSFPPSAPFSTYLFALHAGPYEVWKSEFKGIPLRLFARESLRKYVQPKDWFEITKAGLEFYATRFGYRYPFIKYDQILVPEFNAGAMENVAAVTFADGLAYRSKPTLAQLRSRAETILHELAHMWFGNLVTMRWWNGLWLNESFATYASHWALETISRE